MTRAFDAACEPSATLLDTGLHALAWAARRFDLTSAWRN